MSCSIRTDGDSGHCLHEKRPDADQVCCFCGDVFEPRHIKGDTHGPYLPKTVAALNKRRRLKRAARKDSSVIALAPGQR